jgi:hypothetical protein
MKTFVKNHLAVSRPPHAQRQGSALPGGLNVLEVKPEYELFASLIARVGGPWGWTRRPRYAGGNRRAVTALLKKPHTRLFLLRREKKVLGYCMTAAPELEKNILEKLGQTAAARPIRPAVIEIENFGLFPESTGKGYGRYFLPEILEKLFADHEIVYPSTRDTNHARVVPFYEDIGMRVIHSETLPDDLLPDTAEGLPAFGT